MNIAATSAADNFRRIPAASELKLTPDAAYVHITSNNTIEGTQWHRLPDVGSVPLVSDASSDILSRPIDVAKYGLIYAGAQKNLGPGGRRRIVIVRDDLLQRRPKSLHTMLNYAVHAENARCTTRRRSSPSTCVGLVLQWLRAEGGLDAIGRTNQRKAAKLYAEIDRTGFYRGHGDRRTVAR